MKVFNNTAIKCNSVQEWDTVVTYYNNFESKNPKVLTFNSLFPTNTFPRDSADCIKVDDSTKWSFCNEQWYKDLGVNIISFTEWQHYTQATLSTKQPTKKFSGTIRIRKEGLQGTNHTTTTWYPSYDILSEYYTKYNKQISLYVLSNDAMFSQSQMQEYFNKGYIEIISQDV